jgi:transposase InsO family protein
MATELRTRLVLDALDMAVTTRRPADTVHHSDQDSQGGLKWSPQHCGGVWCDDGPATFGSEATR